MVDFDKNGLSPTSAPVQFTVEQVVKMRNELEGYLADSIREFERKTGLEVSSINMCRHTTSGMRQAELVYLQTKVELT